MGSPKSKMLKKHCVHTAHVGSFVSCPYFINSLHSIYAVFRILSNPEMT